MPCEYTILKAQKADAEEILRLQYAAYQSEAILYNDFSIQPLTQTLEHAIAEFEDSVVLKAVLNCEIIGSVRACEKQNTAYIGKLMVLPAYQNRGIGKRLLHAIEGEFQGRRFELFTGAKSSKNIALYEQCGYTRFKTEEGAPELSFVYLEKCAVHFNKIIAGDFLRETQYVDLSAPIIQAKADELFDDITDDLQKVRIAYEFVQNKIPHSFDIDAKIITAKASDVLKYETGICHAKANLLAALLRSQGIPAGFCFQHLTLMDDGSAGYCVHCYNAVWLNGRWVKLDARGNKPGVNAQFSLDEPVLAFPPRPEYDEYFWPGIYAAPHIETMRMLEQAKDIQDVIDNIPDMITEKPDIAE